MSVQIERDWELGFIKLQQCLCFSAAVSPLRQSIRLFSSVRIPYLPMGGEFVGDSPCGGKIGNLEIYDPCKDEVVTIGDKIVPMVLLDDMRVIGSSHGWSVSLNEADATVLLSDEFKPFPSESPPRVISLPPLAPMSSCQTNLVTSVSMSSSPEHDDCVVAVKFWGPRLSFCRPACDSEWTNITVPNSNYYSSRLMYSKKDRVFYMPTLGAHYTSQWDLTNNNHSPKLNKLHFCNIPQLPQSEWELLDSCFRSSEHLVESSTGQSYIVKCYGQSKEALNDSGEVVSLHQTPIRLMVFSLEEGNKACYTEDIGDLCIFISNAEPFCLKASSFPGLTPNSVYFIDSGVAACNLSTRTFRNFNIRKGSKPHRYGAPFWLPPLQD